MITHLSEVGYRKRYRNSHLTFTGRNYLSVHQKNISKIVKGIGAKKDSYGSVLVKSVIIKLEDGWNN